MKPSGLLSEHKKVTLFIPLGEFVEFSRTSCRKNKKKFLKLSKQNELSRKPFYTKNKSVPWNLLAQFLGKLLLPHKLLFWKWPKTPKFWGFWWRHKQPFLFFMKILLIFLSLIIWESLLKIITWLKFIY